MTDVIEMIDSVTGEIIDEQQLAEQLLKQAKEQGLDLVGPDGMLNGLTKRVLETALEAEMSEHLGYEKHAVSASENARNGTRAKTVLTEVGPVQVDVPRDREGSFDPKIVKKRQRRLTGVDEIVLSLTARGLTTGEVAAHFDDVYGASVSKDTISRITDKVIEEMTEWLSRRQCDHPDPGRMALTAAFRPACASEVTRATPSGSASVATFSPRSRRLRRNSVQKSVVSASPSAIPRISRLPSPLTPVATTRAWETTRPRWRTSR